MRFILLGFILITINTICYGVSYETRVSFTSQGLLEEWHNSDYYFMPMQTPQLRQEAGHWVLDGSRRSHNYFPATVAAPVPGNFTVEGARLSSRIDPTVPGQKVLQVSSDSGEWAIHIQPFDIVIDAVNPVRTKNLGMALSFYAKGKSGSTVKVSLDGQGLDFEKKPNRSWQALSKAQRNKGKPTVSKEIFSTENIITVSNQWTRYLITLPCPKHFESKIALSFSGVGTTEFAGMQLEKVGEHPSYSWNPTPWLAGGKTRINASPSLPSPMLFVPGETGAIAINVKLAISQADEKPNVRCQFLEMPGRLSIGTPLTYLFKGKTKVRLKADTLLKKLQDGRYHWVVLSWDKDQVRLMVDDRLVAHTKIPQGVAADSLRDTASLGIFPQGGWLSPPTGSLREVLFYNNPLTAQDVAALLQREPTEKMFMLERPHRWVFHRDEVNSEWLMKVRSSGDIKGWTVAVEGLPKAVIDLQEDGQLKITFNPSLLPAGRREVKITGTNGKENINFSREVLICPARPRDYFGIVNWPGNAMVSQNKADWYKKLGINTLCGTLGTVAYQNRLAASGFYTWYRWHFLPKTPHPRAASNQQYTRDEAEETAQIVKHYPWMIGCLLNSEGHGDSNIEKAPKLLNYAKKRFGFDKTAPVNSGENFENFSLRPKLDLSKFADTGLVPDDYLPLRYGLWLLSEGDGYAWTGAEIKKIIQKQLPGMKFVVEPNIWITGRPDWADIIAQWRYADDNAFILSKYRNTSDRAKSLDLGFCPLVGLNYDGSQRYLLDENGRKTKKVVPSPAMAAADIWLVLGNQCNQFYFYNLEEYGPKGNANRWIRPGFYERIEKVLKEFKRLAPVVAPLPRPTARLAVLYSHTNSLGVRNQQWWHSYGKLFYNFRVEMVRNNVPCDLIFEKDIKKGALKKYDKLYFPTAHYLETSTWQEISDWRSGGGKLILDNDAGKAFQSRADQVVNIIAYEGALKAPIINQTEMETWLNELKGPTEVLQGQAYIMSKEASDSTIYVVVNNAWEETVLKNSSAEKSSDIMTELAEIKERNKGNMKLNKPLFDTGIEQNVKLAIAVSSSDSAIYLMNSGKRLKSTFDPEKKSMLLDLLLKPGQGQVLAVTPSPIGGIKLQLPRHGVAGKTSTLVVHLEKKHGKILNVDLGVNVRITQPDGKQFDGSGIYRLMKGQTKIPLRIPLTAQKGPWNIKVECLASGTSASKTLTIK